MLFSEYMHEWLYGENGYYGSYHPIGKKGDFYTAVSTSKFFGGSIAQHIIKRIDEGFLTPDSLICEIGAHHGYLLADIIEFLHTLRPQLLQTLRFGIVERFDALQSQQKHYFEESFGDVIKLEHYYDVSEINASCAFFIANEIFDAFACELFYKEKIGRVQEGKVIFDIDSPECCEHALKYKKDRGEIAVGYESFAASISKSVPKFEFMSFDYGELDARSDFSIRVYQEHKVYPLFDEAIELEKIFATADITYDVNFSHVKEAFESEGMKCVQYATQLVALVEMGILDLLATLKEKASDEIYIQELEKVKVLITPSLMGERFKMIRFLQE
ncbi:MAG: SAM-dependent methyltransferase [Sulfuricurvum sp.]|nr:SAM-dependent methyltransferase [Sulfuricurvum sp.]MDP3023640.1 SAM-dependent methyltransferase [Sulfuricurvum sp.]